MNLILFYIYRFLRILKVLITRRCRNESSIFYWLHSWVFTSFKMVFYELSACAFYSENRVFCSDVTL